MTDLINLAISSVFVNNILLAYFLGMCSFIACSKNIKTATGLGFAVVFVLTITVPINWLIHTFLLKDGGLHWLGLPQIDLSFLEFITFIAVIAAMVQIVEMLIDKYSPPLYTALGVFLPLIAVNCAILGTSLFMVERQLNFSQSVVFGFSSGAGWMLAVVLMAAIQKKLRYADIPKGLQGFGITVITAGLMAISFMLFSGISL